MNSAMFPIAIDLAVAAEYTVLRQLSDNGNVLRHGDRLPMDSPIRKLPETLRLLCCQNALRLDSVPPRLSDEQEKQLLVAAGVVESGLDGKPVHAAKSPPRARRR